MLTMFRKSTLKLYIPLFIYYQVVIYVFNKKLKEELKNTKKNLEIEENTNRELTKRNIELARKTREQDEAIEANDKRFEFLNEKTEKISETIEKFNADITTSNKAKDILNHFLAYSLLPNSCSHTLEFTRGGFILTFSPDNFNRAKFPTMKYSVYRGDYNEIDANLEIIGNIENKVVYDIFMKYLNQDPKLESHLFMNGDKIVIYQKRYSYLETRKFIEDVIGMYEKATEHYRNIVLNIPNNQPQ